MSLISLAKLKIVQYINFCTYIYVRKQPSFNIVVFLLYFNSLVKVYHVDPESPTPWYREN